MDYANALPAADLPRCVLVCDFERFLFEPFVGVERKRNKEENKQQGQTMSFDFASSSERHFKAARLLDTDSQIADAAHLYGLAAECGVKAVLKGTQSINLASDGDIADAAAKQHIDKLIPVLGVIGQGRTWPRYYQMISASIGCFASWSVFDRYKDETAITIADYPVWKAAAESVGAMYTLAKSEGCA